MDNDLKFHIFMAELVFIVYPMGMVGGAAIEHYSPEGLAWMF